MAYVSIPQDLNKVKIKVLFGLTKRQLICFGAAALVGVPLFFLVKEAVNSTNVRLTRKKEVLDIYHRAVMVGKSENEKNSPER